MVSPVSGCLCCLARCLVEYAVQICRVSQMVVSCSLSSLSVGDLAAVFAVFARLVPVQVLCPHSEQSEHSEHSEQSEEHSQRMLNRYGLDIHGLEQSHQTYRVYPERQIRYHVTTSLMQQIPLVQGPNPTFS